MKKRILVVLLIAIMIIGVVACGPSNTETGDTPTSQPTDEGGSSAGGNDDAGTTDGGGIKIGVSFATLQEERWQTDLSIMEDKAKELGVEIISQSANGDENLQISQAENMITQGIDVLVVIAQNGAAAAPIVESAHNAGVPVIAYDRLITDCDLDFYITFDCTKVGEIQAQYAVDHAPKGNYFLIGGSPTDNNAHLMRNGQMNILQPYIDSGDIKVVVDQWATGWNPEEALKYVEDGLSANNNDVVSVVTSNDGCAGAAIQALSEQGLAGDVVVTGLDADLAACQRIVEGTQSMTVYRRFAIVDNMTVEAAVAMAKGEDLSELFDTTTVENGQKDVLSVLMTSEEDMFPLTKDNMNIAIEDGWLPKEEIYKNIPESEWPE
ncbi:sugar ABC transporter substrate-binding protein [Christensenella intestinihominis]|uniref:sugar ABC transporter substrate-binding protein n=1 Tax=Christensenella intestinihominis TaxID=1851429 RepID=UPI000AD189C9|nr:substrate-binding domain-containing protein [Christensenella intestinihominis]